MTEKGEVTSVALQQEAAGATTNVGSKDGSFFNYGKLRAWRSELMSNLRYTTLLTEASGSMGDLGTFVPIVVALTLVNGLDLSTSLIFTGVYNILTGLLFGVPMPVQPMKSIASVAISQGPSFSIDEVMAAGILTAAVLFGLGVTGLMGLVQRFVPLPVVRGIQLSQGLVVLVRGAGRGRRLQRHHGLRLLSRRPPPAHAPGHEPRPHLGLLLRQAPPPHARHQQEEGAAAAPRRRCGCRAALSSPPWLVIRHR